MKLYEHVQFIVIFETLGTGDVVITVTQDAATAGTTSTTAIAARYRRLIEYGTDTMGATTALASTGLTIAHATDDNHTFVIDVDSSDMTEPAKPYVGLTCTSASTSMVNTVLALLWPKYPQETNSGALT